MRDVAQRDELARAGGAVPAGVRTGAVADAAAARVIAGPSNPAIGWPILCMGTTEANPTRAASRAHASRQRL